MRERAGDDDVLVRVKHALLVGLDESQGRQGSTALREALDLDRLAFGSDVEAFIARWMPRDAAFGAFAQAASELLAATECVVPVAPTRESCCDQRESEGQLVRPI